MGHVSGLVRVIVLPGRNADSMSKSSYLNETQPKREEKSCADQGDDDDGYVLLTYRDAGAPNERVELVDELSQKFHKCL